VSHSGLGPLPGQPATQNVFADLRDAILTGRLAPGDTVPPERELALLFGVNRYTVREALQRLQHAGFVRIVPGGRTTVRDVRATAGLDLLAHLADVAGEPDPSIVRDGLEMRRSIGREAARLAAGRGTAQSHAQIIARCTDYGDDAHPDADRCFWREIVESSDNFAFRLALNSLERAIDSWPDSMDPVLAADRADLLPHAPLAAAIAERDVERAAALADAILSQAVDTWTALAGERG
jgi:GntR family transcriptional regulator, transcriptional repressor for pyruvate dehydrogenase complex